MEKKTDTDIFWTLDIIKHAYNWFWTGFDEIEAISDDNRVNSLEACKCVSLILSEMFIFGAI